MTNIHEIDLTLKDIEAHPEDHQQSTWGRQRFDSVGDACGTSMCAAGFTVVRHGYTLLFDHLGEAGSCRSPLGGDEPVFSAAQRILDLTFDDAERFFLGHHTLDDLHDLRDILANGESLSDYDW